MAIAPMLLALCGLAAVPCAQAQAEPPSAPVKIVEDTALGVEIGWIDRDDTVAFVGLLPEGWTFSVKIDVNRDGIWGGGANGLKEDDDAKIDDAFVDRLIGIDRQGGFCGAIIYSSSPENADIVYATSTCSGDLIKGEVRQSRPNAGGRVQIVYSVPVADVFGGGREAALALSVWDGEGLNYYYSASAPFVALRQLPSD